MSMNLPKKAKDIKGVIAIAELRRAHLIIVILAISFAIMIGFVSTFEVQFNVVLGFIAITLLLLVATVSAGTIAALNKR